MAEDAIGEDTRRASFAETLRRHGDIVEFDVQEGWLVLTQPGGASAILARDVDPGLGEWIVSALAGQSSWLG